ncbi:WD40 repeat domain-containing protein [Anabaenopsis arnoldii]|uniref:WD40 repeat domain-containing protein n=1 Tax=Anabaenopsis arnoldii TaxID=2152938 RepID=A0ABT5AQ11_9CYAN|nr:WD40 repeat domain-containing protein [Anabaenopsis arnoldii]MDB9538989.1 WD40 repeat domain-containing protein [Anabaenopsis arnoldii]
MGTQIYSCMRYGLFPNNPISIITSSPSFSLEKTLTGHSDEVSSVDFSPDGRTLASGSGNGTIKIWRGR